MNNCCGINNKTTLWRQKLKISYPKISTSWTDNIPFYRYLFVSESSSTHRNLLKDDPGIRIIPGGANRKTDALKAPRATKLLLIE